MKSSFNNFSKSHLPFQSLLKRSSISSSPFSSLQRRLSFSLLLGAATITTSAVGYADEIYRWTDASGHSHFGANPPKGAKNVVPLSEKRFSKYSSDKLLKGYKQKNITSAIEQELKGSDAEKAAAEQGENITVDATVPVEPVPTLPNSADPTQGAITSSTGNAVTGNSATAPATNGIKDKELSGGKFFREKDLPIGINLNETPSVTTEANDKSHTATQTSTAEQSKYDPAIRVRPNPNLKRPSIYSGAQDNSAYEHGPTLEHYAPSVKWGPNGEVLACSVRVRNTSLIPAKEIFVTFEFADGTLLPANGPGEIDGYSESTYALPKELLPLALRKVVDKAENMPPKVNVQGE